MKLLLTLLCALTLSGCASLQISDISPGQGLTCDVSTAIDVFSTARLFVRRDCELVPLHRLPA